MPAPLVISSLRTPVRRLTISIFTPGIRAPEESVTVPRMSPAFVFCAGAIPAVLAIKSISSVFIFRLDAVSSGSDFPALPQRQVAQVTGAGAGDARRDRRVRRLP